MVVFELVHLHVVEGMSVGIGVLWGVKVTVVLPVVYGTPSCAQQMETTVALFASQTATETQCIVGSYR